MKHAARSHGKRNAGRGRSGLVAILAMFLISTLVGPSFASMPPVVEETPEPEPKSAEVVAEGEAEATGIAEQWGIEITSIRLSANGHMIDYRYRVLDADKATDLFKRQIKPHLIHQKSQRVLAVPETAKLGPLRNSNMPQEGRIYWMFFGNAGKLVQPGDEVTVVIGDFRVENLVVE